MGLYRCISVSDAFRCRPDTFCFLRSQNTRKGVVIRTLITRACYYRAIIIRITALHAEFCDVTVGAACENLLKCARA